MRASQILPKEYVGTEHLRDLVNAGFRHSLLRRSSDDRRVIMDDYYHLVLQSHSR